MLFFNLLLEGSDDITFWQGILAENVVCTESFSGKEGLNELIEEPQLNFPNIVFVRDRDYIDITTLKERMFVYDHCSLELMLLSNREVSDSFHRVYYIGDKDKDTYIIHAMRELAPFSVLRKRNEKEGLGIAFSKIGIGDQIIDNNVNVHIIFDRLHRSDAEYQLCKTLACELSDNQLWDITNGHDICLYLGKVSRSAKKNIGEDGVRNALFAIYRKDDFKITKLYDRMNEYAMNHDLRIFK